MSSHYSYVSCMETDRLFELMFPDSAIADSAIAKLFSCGEKKSAYIICHGLAPNFSQQLKDQVRLLDSLVILFDESFNRFTQNKQMDIHIRFFDDGRNAVHTRYFISAFLGHATAANMVDVVCCLFLPTPPHSRISTQTTRDWIRSLQSTSNAHSMRSCGW